MAHRRRETGTRREMATAMCVPREKLLRLLLDGPRSPDTMPRPTLPGGRKPSRRRVSRSRPGPVDPSPRPRAEICDRIRSQSPAQRPAPPGFASFVGPPCAPAARRLLAVAVTWEDYSAAEHTSDPRDRTSSRRRTAGSRSRARCRGTQSRDSPEGRDRRRRRRRLIARAKPSRGRSRHPTFRRRRTS